MMTGQHFTEAYQDYGRIEQAIHYLESNFRRHPSLDEIAESVHLSKYHFQRLFKRWAGISPTQFLQFLTVEYAKNTIQETNNILGTTFEAGLSSPGRLHDLFISFEAMTPGEFKKQGAGLRISYGFHKTPFGKCLLAKTERGICGLYFQDDGAPSALEQLASYWPDADFVEAEPETKALVDQIFSPAASEQSRPFNLLLKGTNFQIQVWKALLSIPPGALVSYQDMAAYLGKPSATRVVANAIARNPIAYLIPCHRVIKKNGVIHRYRWGTARKKALLGWEASQAHRTVPGS